MMDKRNAIIISILLLILSLLFVFANNPSGYILHMRIIKFLNILILSCAISISSFTFQTISNNNILTPGILGFDSLFILIQSVTLFITNKQLPVYISFILNTSFMICLSYILFNFLFRKRYIYEVLLTGTVIGILFRSITSVIISSVDSVTFDIVQSFTFANFDNINKNLMLFSLIPLIFSIYKIYNNSHEFDVFLLGKDIASNLGIDVKKFIRNNIIYITILVSITTSLIGPIIFLGLFISNITRLLFKTYKHENLIILSCMIGFLIMLISVYLDERVFMYTNLNLLIDGFGSLYFIYLCMRKRISV